MRILAIKARLMPKKKAIRKNADKTKLVKRPESTAPDQGSENEGKYNFGGIPERNLKKNLGC